MLGAIASHYADDSSGGTLEPDDVAGLTQWLDADQLALSDLDPVSTWADVSGNGYDYTAGTAPTFRTNQLNGKPVVEFTSTSSHYLQLVGGFPSDFTAWTMFLVWQTNGTQQQQVVGVDASGYNDDLLFGVDPGASNTPDGVVSCQIHQASGSALRTLSEGSAPGATWRINDFAYDGAAFDLRLNGSLVGSVAVSGLKIRSGSGTSLWQLGRNAQASGRYLSGGVAEMVLYGAALSTADRNAVRAGLGAKYGITV